MYTIPAPSLPSSLSLFTVRRRCRRRRGGVLLQSQQTRTISKEERKKITKRRHSLTTYLLQDIYYYMTKWSEIYLYIYMKKNFGKKNWITKGHKNRMNITQFLNTRNRGSRAYSSFVYWLQWWRWQWQQRRWWRYRYRWYVCLCVWSYRYHLRRTNKSKVNV